jgi:hemolysin III
MGDVVKRPQSLGEEIANSVSHGLGLVAALVVVPILVFRAVPHGRAALVGVSIFGATLAFMYLASTLYHALPPTRAKRVLQLVDHGAIYLLIAGSYTPFMLGALRGALGYGMLAVVWTLALSGIVFKGVWRMKYPRLSTALYLFMGWLALVAAVPLWRALSAADIAWLVAGGLAYTAGVVFYVLDHRVRYAHFVWHIFVLTGSTCHVMAVLGLSIVTG